MVSSGSPEKPPRSGRVLALDLGARRIGVAVSDSERTLASPRAVLVRSADEASDRRHLAALVVELEAVEVVVGLPLSLDGHEGPAARGVRAQVSELESLLAVPVTTWDERLTTVEALRLRRERHELQAARGGSARRNAERGGRTAGGGSARGNAERGGRTARDQPALGIAGPRAPARVSRRTEREMTGAGPKLRKAVDSEAAAIILQSYLDSRSPRG